MDNMGVCLNTYLCVCTHPKKRNLEERAPPNTLFTHHPPYAPNNDPKPGAHGDAAARDRAGAGGAGAGQHLAQDARQGG